MKAKTRPAAWKILLGFATIYLVWGSTFLAIRIGVREFPPLVMAGMRFLAAGFILYVWAITRGESSPRGREWASAALLAVLIFVVDYGLLFWAEQRVASGVAAVMMATIPVFTAIAEIILLRTQRFTRRLVVALLIGIAGVLVLVSRGLNLGAASIDAAGATGLIVAAIGWSVSSALTLKLPLPASKVMNSGAQMLLGGIFLLIAATGLGEFHNFHPADVSRGAWLALLYLIVPGSIIAFTAYIWLIHHESPTKVGTYAYVNPVVAVLLGYFVGGEALGPRTIVGSLCVLISVVLLTSARTRKPAANVSLEDAAKAATS